MSPQQIFDALDELGGTPAVIAARLKAEGCTGLRGEEGMCPIANYLNKRFEDAATVYFDEVYVGRCLLCGPPPAVTAFVRDFDLGEFPDLESDSN